MSQPALQKKPGDIVSAANGYLVDFSVLHLFATGGDTIASVVGSPVIKQITGTAPDPSPLTSSGTAINTAKTGVLVGLSGGSDGSNYKLTVTVNTTLGNTQEGDALVSVSSQPTGVAS